MLTNEERKIIEENHNLIYFFIKHFKVDIEEYYDLFAIKYVECIKLWDKHKGNLSTFLGQNFLNVIRYEKQKKKALKRIGELDTISLNLIISKEKIWYLENVIPDTTINVEYLIELKETIEFFKKYEETKLKMKGFSNKEIAEKLNCDVKVVSQNINDIKQKYNELFKGDNRWINQKGRKASFICENGHRRF